MNGRCNPFSNNPPKRGKEMHEKIGCHATLFRVMPLGQETLRLYKGHLKENKGAFAS